jgi:Secretion system C-terminal sorting domain
VEKSDLEVKIYPNPFGKSTTIEVKGEYENLTFKVCDLNGRVVRCDKFSDKTMIFERKNLLSGFYFYEIMSDEKRIQTGKIIVQ